MGSDLILASPEIKVATKADTISCKQVQAVQPQPQTPSQPVQLNMSNKEAECLTKLKEMAKGKQHRT